MTARRRVIWMDDERWDELGRVVERLQTSTKASGLTQKITRSLVILDCLDRGHFRVERERTAAPVYPGSVLTEVDLGIGLPARTPKERQASRDAILRKINRGG